MTRILRKEDRSEYIINTDKNKLKNNKKAENIVIMYLNISGINHEKERNVEEIIEQNKNTIFLITETHMKYDEVEVDKSIKKIIKMRDINDKKGGGLMAMFKKKEFDCVFEIDNGNKDIMILVIEKGRIRFKIILIYFSVINKRPEDINRNDKIKKEIEKEIEREDIPTIIIGDVNGHIEGLGYQREDRNGRIIKEWLEKYNMTLLNEDEKCIGEITWRRNEQSSIIDMAIMNEDLYKYFTGMYVDEKQEIFDLSDHNLIRVDLEFERKKDYNKGEKIRREYVCTKEESLNKFTEKMEDKIKNQNIEDIEELIRVIKVTTEEVLMKVYIKKQTVDKIKEKPWFNEEIREQIKIRKKYNRIKRNTENNEQMNYYQKLYIEQKNKVKSMIRGEITKYENKLTQEIKNNKGNRDKQWEYINELRGKYNTQEELYIYNEDGRKLEGREEEEEIYQQWNEIYCNKENKMAEVWNERIKKDYENEKDKFMRLKKLRTMANGVIEDKTEEMMIPQILAEHYTMEYRIEQPINTMERVKITEKELREEIKSLKKKKACGPDGVKNEVLIAMGESKICREVLLKCLNNVLSNKKIPASWKTSITKTIPKKSKPTAKDLRPIALTDTTYKLLMAIISKKIENHLRRNNKMNECQAGFTSGRRIEDNVFLLEGCIEIAKRRKKGLIATAIDFKKAYDSIKRETIVTTMKLYNIHENIIDLVTEIYNKDNTIMKVRDGLELKFNITAGIRQGCNLSATLFKMITMKIMEELEEKTKGIEIGDGRINALFYADDGMILEESIEETERAIKQLVEVAGKYGLKINREKSKIIMFNMKTDQTEIENIEIVDKVKYLGITICNRRDIYKEHKKEMSIKARKMEMMLYGVIGRSCNRMMVGKTYWKSVALPSILFGTEVVAFNKEEIRKLQNYENNIYRKLLRAPKYTPIAAMRGEVGASTMEARVAKSKINYYKSLRSGRNELLTKMVDKLQEMNTKWIKDLIKRANVTGIDISNLREIGTEQVKKMISKWDTECWREEMEKKSTLEIYRKFKVEIGEVSYFNDEESRIYFQVRTNTLKLNYWRRHTDRKIECELCGGEKEDLEHFLLDCTELEEERREIIKLQRPQEEDRQRIIGELLFGYGNNERQNIYNMWHKRNKIIDLQLAAPVGTW